MPEFFLSITVGIPEYQLYSYYRLKELGLNIGFKVDNNRLNLSFDISLLNRQPKPYLIKKKQCCYIHHCFFIIRFLRSSYSENRRSVRH